MNTAMLAKQELTAQQLTIVQSEMNKKGKSKGIAYAIWFFTASLGGHRYYAGDIGIGIAMTCTLGGLGIWGLIDGFFIGKRIEQKNEELEMEAINFVKALEK